MMTMIQVCNQGISILLSLTGVTVRGMGPRARMRAIIEAANEADEPRLIQ